MSFSLCHVKLLISLDCGLCERNGSSRHCLSHAMIKVKSPFEDLDELSSTDNSDDEGNCLDIGGQLNRMREHIKNINTNMAETDQLEELQTKFTDDLNNLREDFTAKFDQVIALLENLKKPTPESISSMEHRYCILGGSRRG